MVSDTCLTLVMHSFIDLGPAGLYIRRNVSKYVNALPLQHIPPVKILDSHCIAEIRQLYTPSELRAGATGWFPEHNKVWEKYGLPF